MCDSTLARTGSARVSTPGLESLHKIWNQCTRSGISNVHQGIIVTNVWIHSRQNRKRSSLYTRFGVSTQDLESKGQMPYCIIPKTCDTIYVYEYTREHNQLIMTTLNTLLYINLSHFIFEKVMFVVCEKWVETRTDCYIDPISLSTIAALLSRLGLYCSTEGH